MDFPVFIMIIFASSFVASFIQRVSGFGFGIFMMTILPLVMPSYGEATALSGILASVTSLLVCIRMWRDIRWNHLWLILAAFMLVSAGSIFTLSKIHDSILNVILGIALIGASIYFLFINIIESKHRIMLRCRIFRYSIKLESIIF